jgi:glycerol kinase
MTSSYVAAVDQGTTSSRCIVFDRTGAIVAQARKEHRQIFPRPGWVEHDAIEIRDNVRAVTAAALQAAGATVGDLAALGITNQRETTVLWDRRTGEPIHNAVVWQDTRTADLIREIGGSAGQDRLRALCGLRASVRHHGHLADLEPDRAARDRRDKRQPDHADELGDIGLGRRAAGGGGRAARHAA